MFLLKDLIPGDIIVSYKPSTDLLLLKNIFDGEVKEYSEDIFGEGCVFPIANHARIIVEKRADGSVEYFHWTFPKAKYEEAEPWLVDPLYSMAFRNKNAKGIDTKAIRIFCDKHEGDLYDIGQLIDMKIGKHVFDFGVHHHVCSSGVRAVMIHLGFKNPISLAVEKTPPCLWPNMPDEYEWLNGNEAISPPLYCEPEKGNAYKLIKEHHEDLLRKNG